MHTEQHTPPVTSSEPVSAPVASTFARAGLVMYTFLIIYASLYPFTGWRSIGLPFWSFLFAPLPYYWTGFDVITNIIGYAPLGLLLIFALYPHVRGLAAATIAILCGALLSGAMESLQTYLPTRVSSNLDFITNIGGVIIGVMAGLLLSRTFLEQSRLLRLRQDWFQHDAGRGLIMVALWPLAQIYPQGSLFGHGHLLPIVSDWLSAWLTTPIDLGNVVQEHLDLSAQEYWLAESIVTACGLTGAILAGTSLLRRQAPKIVLMLLLLLAALAVKTMTSALYFAPENAFVWLTPGAKGGLLFGVMLVAGLAFAPRVAQRRLAIVSLLLSFIAVNVVPPTPYFASTMQTWLQGKFLNFNGAAHFLALTWPFFAWWFLLHPTTRPRGK